MPEYGIALVNQEDLDLWQALTHIKESYDLDIMEGIEADILDVVFTWLEKA